MAESFGMDSHAVDGNDVLEIFERSKNAVEACRNGEGPVFIEFMTYRFRGHVGPDDNIQGGHTDIRPRDEIESWRKKDPIVSFEGYLEENGLMGREEIIAIRAEVEEAIEFARGSAFPDPCDLDKYVFAQ